MERAGRKPLTVGRLARIATMLFVAAIFIFPIVGFSAMSFRDAGDVAAGQGGFLDLGGMSLTHVAFSWSQVNGFGPGSGGLFTRWMINLVILAVGGGLLAVIAALPAGYAMARLRFWFRRL